MASTHNISEIKDKDIIDALNEGVYLCDRDRRITYWNKSAERITGWTAEDVVGRQCFDNVLCHVDKDGHQLCGEEYCPLHRSIVTDTGTPGSLLVYAKGKDGRRVPMFVSVAPIHDANGEVLGGVETFRDASETVPDLERAKAIQQRALEHDLPDDDRVSFATYYIPHDIIGGDFYAIRKVDDHRYGLILADVMGHGIAAALYTMHLSQLWERFCHLIEEPAECTEQLNSELIKVVKSDRSFATAACCLVDLERREFRFSGAGGPEVLLMRRDGSCEELESPGFPLAVIEDATFDETVAEIREGDSLLLFSDGAIEVTNSADKLLGIGGLVDMLRAQGYPESRIDMAALEEQLLKYSNSIRLQDDLTLIEVRFGKIPNGVAAPN
jgi:sigma-B regulation protein RsbU (phosphoserine phosphatase)